MTTVKTRLDSSQGVVTTLNDVGVSIEANVGNQGFSPFKLDKVNAITAAGTLTAANAGLNTIAGGSAVVSIMPLASAVPGALFTFRNLSAQPHALTGSQETAGKKVFCDGTDSGSKVALSNFVGRSITLLSDGVSFVILGTSGSYTISGT